MSSKPCVLVFAGSDPSGGAGISADIEAIAFQDAHALPIITAVTVQDNDSVFAVHPIALDVILEQANVIANKIRLSAIKLGIVGNSENALGIAQWIAQYKQQHPHVPVIVDPVLASGHGDALSTNDNVRAMLMPLLRVATLITPNLPEAQKLCPDAHSPSHQARYLLSLGANDVLIKGGHGEDEKITNQWFYGDECKRWQWPRLEGSFHGSGCTLASAIAGQLATGRPMRLALEVAQTYCHHSLQQAYSIASGQRIPQRLL